LHLILNFAGGIKLEMDGSDNRKLVSPVYPSISLVFRPCHSASLRAGFDWARFCQKMQNLDWPNAGFAYSV